MNNRPLRVRILSDLHREFGPTDIPMLDADLILLAGDISTKQNALPWIRNFSGSTPTLYVCGNHEFYGDKLPRVTERLIEQTQNSNIHLLENASFRIGEWNVFGCTLWTDMNLQGDWMEGAAMAAEVMNDYKRVRNSNRGYKHLSPRDTRSLHLQSVARMTEFLEQHDPEKSIVLTHHAPSALSLPEDRRDKTISSAYASHLDWLIEKYQPALWIHGHIHHSNDYRIGKTRVISNPQGYPETPNMDFIPDMIFEL